MRPSGLGPSFYVGAYTTDMGGESTGIVVLDSRPDGSLALRPGVVPTPSPSYLHAAGSTLYAVAEATGEVRAFTRGDEESLEFVAAAPAGGEAPCQLSTVPGATGDDLLLVANYGSGTVGVIERESFALRQELAGTGSGPHPAQDGPHAHSTIVIDRTDGGRDVLSADLGADRIHRYSVIENRLELRGSLELPAGTGPRDFLRHSDGALWVLAELSLELLVITVTDDSLEITATLPIPGRETGDHAAGISLSSDGRFAYVALRGSNRVAWFEVHDAGHRLAGVGWVPSVGDGPRHHLVEGNFLHVACQLSSTVCTFELKENGRPELVRTPEKVPSPTFLLRA